MSECLRDYTFVHTEYLNYILGEHDQAMEIYVALSQGLIDLLAAIYLILFIVGKGLKTTRFTFSIVVFYATRQFFIKVFIVGHPEGLLKVRQDTYWSMVNLVDKDDQFFSGKIAVATLLTREFFNLRWHKTYFLACLLLLNEWIMLTSMRSHYAIDLLVAFVYASICIRFGEQLSFFIDVKFLGLKRHMRNRYYYDPCPRCGWGNYNASNLIG